MMLSIITPSFNQGRFLERTILSIASQYRSNIEHVVMDGGSQDETLQILKRYPHVTFVSEKDGGQAHAINKGLRMTSGEIIGWLNSDDIYYPETLQKVTTFFDRHPEIDILYGQAHHIDESDTILSPYPTQKWNMDALKKTCFLCQPAVFWRRRLLDDIGYFNEALYYCMDYEFWLRAALQGARFYYMQEFLAGSRWYATTKTMQNPVAANFEALTMLSQKLGRVPTNWLKVFTGSWIKNRIKISKGPLYKVFFIMLFFGAAVRWNGVIGGGRACFEIIHKINSR